MHLEYCQDRSIVHDDRNLHTDTNTNTYTHTAQASQSVSHPPTHPPHPPTPTHYGTHHNPMLLVCVCARARFLPSLYPLPFRPLFLPIALLSRSHFRICVLIQSPTHPHTHTPSFSFALAQSRSGSRSPSCPLCARYISPSLFLSLFSLSSLSLLSLSFSLSLSLSLLSFSLSLSPSLSLLGHRDVSEPSHHPSGLSVSSASSTSRSTTGIESSAG